jgi:hypothetical protein
MVSLLVLSLLAAPAEDASQEAPVAVASAILPERVRRGVAPADAPLRPVLEEEGPRWLVPLAHSALLVGGMRVSLSLLWPRAFDPTRLEENLGNFQRALTLPPEFHAGRPLLESDLDPWWLNGVGHGLFGAEVHLRFRQCGHPAWGAALATAAVSTFWEYGVESFHKRPSAVDLVWTPLFGALLGEGRYQLHRLLERQGPGLGWTVLRTVVDPLGEAERRLVGTGC